MTARTEAQSKVETFTIQQLAQGLPRLPGSFAIREVQQSPEPRFEIQRTWNRKVFVFRVGAIISGEELRSLRTALHLDSHTMSDTQFYADLRMIDQSSPPDAQLTPDDAATLLHRLETPGEWVDASDVAARLSRLDAVP
ncbi:MAG TPA: hypothetical protein VM165_17215 [Planctomycetaceae bacterium]|nr:hypothetical protein [Planctomycetaceae bacterium]